MSRTNRQEARMTIAQVMQAVGCTEEQAREALAHFAAHPVTPEERATLAAIDAEAEAARAALREAHDLVSTVVS